MDTSRLRNSVGLSRLSRSEEQALLFDAGSVVELCALLRLGLSDHRPLRRILADLEEVAPWLLSLATSF